MYDRIRARLEAVDLSPDLLLDIAALAPLSLFGLARQVATQLPARLRKRVLKLLAEREVEAGRAHRAWQPARAPAPATLAPGLFSLLLRSADEDRQTLLEPILHRMHEAFEAQADGGEAVAVEEMLEAAVAAAKGYGEAPGDHVAYEEAADGGEADAGERPARRYLLWAPPELEPVPARPRAATRTVRRRRVVNSGFATIGERDEPLPTWEPLTRDRRYLYWIEIGPPVRGSIEAKETEVLPEERLTPGDRLRVVVFGFPGEIRIDDAARVGEFVYGEDGSFGVASQPGDDRHRPGSVRAHTGRRARRMFFPIRTPAKAGCYHIRSSVYFRNVLVQSRVVTACVEQRPIRGRALSARVDFQLARLLSSKDLAPIQPHSLSVHLNSNGDHTHSFRFASFTEGQPPIATDATLEATALQDLIGQARGALRSASWGSTGDWISGTPFRYSTAPYPDQKADLFELMRKGRQLYDALINDLAGGPDAATKLRDQMRAPGRVQIVNTGPPSELIPTSLIYDYPNVDPALGGLSLCEAFTASRKTSAPLEESPCFSGRCVSLDKAQVVCPSGFWGFRHAIGVPVQPRWGQPAPLRSTFSGSPTLGMAVYPGFALLPKHRQDIAQQRPSWTLLPPAETYTSAIDLLKARPHVVYFYCHGGISAENVPYLLVGRDRGQLLSSPSLRWDDADRYRLPRSLVLLNGCETVALEPDRAMSLVKAFVDNVAASGVIGTEITVNENLASQFANVLLAHIRSGLEIGAAVRLARLALLKLGNPLGLVYLPLVSADAAIVAA